ncbi:hypothetical protein LCGC14_0552280 [marine sediment metagenome]|uniref:Uncharacterized protein n=1 Tax=marine sediment metagenome TaxID=412755 RepID=A0A0F9RPG6_9ZZZZ
MSYGDPEPPINPPEGHRDCDRCGQREGEIECNNQLLCVQCVAVETEVRDWNHAPVARWYLWLWLWAVPGEWWGTIRVKQWRGKYYVVGERTEQEANEAEGRR